MFKNFLYYYNINEFKSLYAKLIIDTALPSTSNISINEDNTNFIVDSNGNPIVLNSGQ